MPEYKNITALKKQISDVKRTIESPNSDYLTGYISALSVTEGMIEEIPTANVCEIPDKGIGELSDGYHTFNELYHHRAVLFSVICNSNPSRAWKSKLHDTGDMFDGMFIVGIETPQGQATYHYDIEPYWDLFKVKELEKAPKWDEHTPQQAIDRISSLSADMVEVRHGEWLLESRIYKMPDDVDEEFYVECPFCHRTFDVPFELEEEKMLTYAKEKYPYCNCGAKMDGKDK